MGGVAPEPLLSAAGDGDGDGVGLRTPSGHHPLAEHLGVPEPLERHPRPELESLPRDHRFEVESRDHGALRVELERSRRGDRPLAPLARRGALIVGPRERSILAPKTMEKC